MPPRYRRPAAAFALCAWLAIILLLGGCGKVVTIILSIAQDNGPAETTGDGTTGGDPAGQDKFLTPDAIAIGIRSARLTGPDGAEFGLFEEANDKPRVVRLDDGDSTMHVFTDVNDGPDEGTYDTLELEIVFYEATITAHNGGAETYMLRVYLDGYAETLDLTDPDDDRTTQDDDLLISADAYTTPATGIYKKADEVYANVDLRWIDETNGNLCPSTAVPPINRADCANNPYQGDDGQFAGYPTIELDLSKSITVDPESDETYTLEIEVRIRDMFFYDDTNDNDQFDFFNGASDDGKVEAAAAGQADFWLGPPTFDVTVAD